MNAQFGSTTVIGPQRTTLVVPPFSHDPTQWAGSSQLLLEFNIGNDYIFSFYLPIEQFGVNFVLAVRWTDDGVTYRYKFWDAGVLNFPVYNGEAISPNAVLEIWSVNTTGGANSVLNTVLTTSVLLYPSQCCNSCLNPSQSTTLVASDPSGLCDYQNPFCDQQPGDDGDPETPPPSPPEEDAPGGGYPTVDDPRYAGFYIFPASGYGIESTTSDYPSDITAVTASWWAQLLANEWLEQGMTSYSERHLAWWFPNHVVSLYDLYTKLASGNTHPSEGPNEWVEFTAPWVLTYVWKP